MPIADNDNGPGPIEVVGGLFGDFYLFMGNPGEFELVKLSLKPTTDPMTVGVTKTVLMQQPCPGCPPVLPPVYGPPLPRPRVPRERPSWLTSV
jgi:hypothetical protein